MNIKTITIVIILAILIGVSIVYVPKFLAKEEISTSQKSISNQKQNPTPTPIPTKPPVKINESSNLKEELSKIEIPDFSKNFDEIKKELQ